MIGEFEMVVTGASRRSNGRQPDQGSRARPEANVATHPRQTTRPAVPKGPPIEPGSYQTRYHPRVPEAA